MRYSHYLMILSMLCMSLLALTPSGATAAEGSKETVNTGTQAAGETEAELLAKKASNPLADVWLLWTQNDFSQLGGDLVPEREYLNTLTFQPLLSFPLFGGDWNLILRPVMQLIRAPVNDDVGELIGFDQNQIRNDSRLAGIASEAFDGSTWGFGDMALFSLIGPNRNDGFIWGVGPTTLLPTASEDFLGTEKFSIGPVVLAARLAPKARCLTCWNLGILWQNWFSIAGDDDREDVARSNIQYFINYRLSATELIGMAPNIIIDWKADSIADDGLTIPIGIGYNRMDFFGRLPIRWGFEFQIPVVKPDNANVDWNIRLYFIPIMKRPAVFGGRGQS